MTYVSLCSYSMAETYGYFLSALCLVDTTLNLLTLVVLRQKNNKKMSTNWLLQASAVLDCLYLLTRLSFLVFRFFVCRDVEWLPPAVRRLFATVTGYLESSASTIHLISVWTVVVITVDRYIVVCLPGEVRVRTLRFAKMIIGCVTVASVVCCLPFFVEWKTGNTVSPLNCDVAKSVAIADQQRGDWSWWLISHQIVCDCFLRTAIPFVVLVMLSSRTILRLCRMTRHFRTPRCRSREQTKIFCKKRNWRRSLMATVLPAMALFICCQLPQLGLRVIHLLRQVLPDVLLNDEVLQQSSDVASGLLVVNATANFFVYCMVGVDFRRSLFRLLSASCNAQRSVTLGRQTCERSARK